MMFLIVMFVPPLYFGLRKQWGALILNLFLYLTACLTLVLLFAGLPIAPLFWALSVGHAGWHLRKEQAREQARMIAEEIKKEIR